jgi:flagellar hook-associated protein 2
MSDITIPGVTSKVDTKSIIDALMDVERVKLTRKEDEVQALKNEKKVWQDINVKLAKLQGAAKNLFGFQNPFNEKIAESTDTAVMTATAGRESVVEEKKFLIKQIATSDRFMSRSIDTKFEAPSGTYRFQVGEKEVTFSFKGGSLKELADIINRKAGKHLSANIVNDTADTQVIIIEAKQTGADSKMLFFDTALEFGLSSGMLQTTRKTQIEVPLDESIRSLIKTSLTPDQYNIEEGRLTLMPSSGETRIPIIPPFELNANMVLEIEVEVEVIEEGVWKPPSPPSGPDVPHVGGAEFQRLRIESEGSKFIPPQWDPPAPPEKIEDPQVLFMGSENQLLALPELDLSGGKKKIQIPIGEMADRIDFLTLRNRNTYRKLSFSDIRIVDPTTRGDYKPLNALSEAGDAVIEMDGIQIRRSKNEIDDLIPGVKLTLLQTSEKPVNLSVKRDTEAIMSDIIDFVGHYNRVLTQIDIVTRNDSSVIEDALYLSEKEQEAAEKNLGLLQGNLSLSQLKNRLRTLLSSPYRTSAGSKLTLLLQMGIATDTSMPGTRTALDKSRLRGYLDIDENLLEEVLTRYPEAVKEIFGADTDGDFIVDGGVAYVINANIQPYVARGGIIAGTTLTLDSTIHRRNQDIDDFNQWLADYEQDLKKKFGMMEGALHSLEQSSKALENFNKSND